MSHHTYDWSFLYKTFSKLRGRQNPLTLDIGCREGEKTEFIKPLTSTIIGLDLVIESVKRAKARGIKAIMGNAMNLPFHDESFDAVTSFHVIEHLDNPIKLVGEIHRVLKRGGFTVLVTPNRKRVTQIIYKFLTKTKEYKYPFNLDHIFEFTQSDLQKLFRESEFVEYHITPLFFGLITNIFGKTIDIGFKSPPCGLQRYCNQYLVWARKA